MQALKARFDAFQRSRLGQFVKKLMDDQVPNLAALLAWGTLSAILPLLLGVLVLAGLVLRDQGRLDAVYATVLGALPEDAASPVRGVLDSMRQGSATQIGILAILVLLVTGSGFFSNMASVFNQVYHVAGRNFFVERLVGVVMLLVTTALLILSTLAAGIGSLTSNLPGILPIGPVLGQVVGWSVSIVSGLALFLLLYRVLPNVRHGWRGVLPGALLSTALALVFSQVFPLYVTVFPPNHAYSVFGVFLVFTFWLYILGFIIVLGAELNAFLLRPVEQPAVTPVSAVAIA